MIERCCSSDVVLDSPVANTDVFPVHNPIRGSEYTEVGPKGGGEEYSAPQSIRVRVAVSPGNYEYFTAHYLETNSDHLGNKTYVYRYSGYSMGGLPVEGTCTFTRH